MTTKLPAAVRDRALQIAHHEMGHYVVARALGFETGGVTLTVTMDLRHKGGATINLVRPISSMDAMRAYLEARIIMLFAGAMAQTLPSAPVGAKRVDLSDAAAILNGALGAERDDAKIRELRHLLRNITYPDTGLTSPDRIATELKAINDRLWLRAQEMVEALAETITGLGAAVVDRMVLVEQWGRPADTYEVVLTGERLERSWPVR
ncbi:MULTISPECIES: peptidase M41 [Pseudomonas]|uniref:peptidase M41 n=1 Tax=Pseudomonas sp. MIL9 TaxID=2807620 RepID=UPI001028FD4F|nr:peptidase M41 [Pseudomonas sp. MIL9]MBM6447227.1 peptidase M41 [Pseudomonas sp. MIL9]RZO05140.1 peptidase M41 [Pseudomonas moorei]